jgi:hypothetical protein
MIPRVHTLSRATTEAAGLAAEHDSGSEALRQLGIQVDRAKKPEAGVAPVCPMLDAAAIVTDAATIEALAGVGSEGRRGRGRSARASTSLAPAVLPPGERNNSHPGPR